MEDNYRIELTRFPQLTDKNHIKGTLVVYLNDSQVGSVQTLERGKGFVNLKTGEYEMTHSMKNKGRQVKCLRPTETRFQTLLIHDADKDDPNNLEGCIAPFLFNDGEWMKSAEASDFLFTYLGGFNLGKKATLKILTNVPGETRTKETWNWNK